MPKTVTDQGTDDDADHGKFCVGCQQLFDLNFVS